MAWNETSSGVFQRPLGLTESGMVIAISTPPISAREPVRIHTSADFTAPYSPGKVTNAFKEAWKALRLLKSPDIAAIFDNRSKFYEVPSVQELERWLNQTFAVAPTGTSVQAVMKEMQTRRELLPSCYLIPSSRGEGTFTGSIILFISHWRTEASGTFQILNQLFDYAADLLTGSTTHEALRRHKLGDEVKLLTPTLEDMLIPKPSTAEAKARVEKRFAHYSSQLPSIDLPIIATFSATPSHVKISQTIYATSSTSSLASACRTHSITVTSAIHSAYIGAIYQIAESDKRSRPYTIMMPAQTRTRLPESSSWREQGCWNAAQMLLLSVPANQDFLTRASALRQQYALAADKKWLNDDMRETSEQALKQFSLTPPEPTALPWITSMGVLDREFLKDTHGTLMIERVSVWADSLGPGIVLGIWTFKGKLNIQIHWNVTFHGDMQIKRIMDVISQKLKAELGVDMAIEDIKAMEI